MKRVILVEGYMDVVSLYQHGVDGCIATLGTALTNEQIRLMKRYAPQVLITYDGRVSEDGSLLIENATSIQDVWIDESGNAWIPE